MATNVSVFDLGLTLASVRYPGSDRPPTWPLPYCPRTALCRTCSGVMRADRAQHLGLLVPDRVGVERDGRLHRHQADQLEDVVGHHVAQRPRSLVVAAAALHPQRLGHGDLDVVHVAPVPDRFEDAVGEAEHHQVLDGLFAQVVVDPVDLLFLQGRTQVAVQRSGPTPDPVRTVFRRSPGASGCCPRRSTLVGQPALVQPAHHRARTGRGRWPGRTGCCRRCGGAVSTSASVFSRPA